MSIRTQYLALLRDLVALPSVSAKHESLPETAKLIADALRGLGAEVLYDDTYFAPFIIGKLTSAVSNAPTVIIYNHYDVQPAEPLDLWDSNPWQLTEKDGKLYGRGVDDDKGNLTARLTAVAEYLSEHNNQLPINITFIIEGSEETSSQHLDDYLAKYQQHLSGDLVIWESGGKNANEEVEIFGGNKGIVTFDVSANTASHDLHSSLAAVVDSAAWRLTQALATLYDNNGHINVSGFYDDVTPPNHREIQLVSALPLTHAALVAQHQITVPLLTDKTGDDLKSTLYFSPTLNIEGIDSGYVGEGVKTVLPAKASAKLEARLVPGMDPDKTLLQIKQHFQSRGFSDILVTKTLGQPGYRSDMSDPEILRVINVTAHYYKAQPVVIPTSPGTGPMYYIHEALGAPIASLGIGYANTNDHAPNENIRLDDYNQHIDVIKALIRSYEK
ncbi:M20/M25/M40 family metallo-hydrolase [Leuconostoc falkenbergense]|uniref:M20/M25/M40 family metallo-hydrolase n=1 Tax=Leuconostoc falkenbergense TaxID=2766470 RepID=UPI001967C71B|nr:M20/M25/M40 family metallo-hydrolase [Leuconostoc falkenbergense]QSB52202.1 M20/M25/M40 family metallo-hydrolase [Leuconostoc falkenbergense]